MNNAVAGYVQERILKMLDEGVVPWQKPWVGNGPKNLISKKDYRGINTLLLGYSRMSNHFTSDFWMTFNQARANGWQVKKGAKSTMVVFWKIGKYQTGKVLDNGKNEEKNSFLLRYYNVFNADQVEGAVIPELPTREHNPVEDAERILANYNGDKGLNITIVEGSNQACYSPILDVINLPAMKQFKSGEEYYSTAFHECVHSTGHKNRLNRLGENDKEWGFGDSYSFEELVAESGACMLDATVGIDTDKVYQNSAGYIKTWRDRIAEDKNLIIRAIGKAQKAVDYILGAGDEEVGVAGEGE